jgi:hypothetical protein
MAEKPYSGNDVVAAYKAVYGGLPAGMMDNQGNLLPQFKDSIYPGTVLKTPSGQSIDSSQLMYMYQQGQGHRLPLLLPPRLPPLIRLPVISIPEPLKEILWPPLPA